MTNDPINHPTHYTSHPSGVEVITITRHMGFNLGNVIKYVLRCDHKGAEIEDLKKARWYLDDEIKRRESEQSVEAAMNRDAVKRPVADILAAAALHASGWIEWNGGQCPTDISVRRVETIDRCGCRDIKRPDYVVWDHAGADSDITAYRVVG